ncbi:MAG: hypothetical protein MJE66_07505 [Proteobacteria bacterium]|nr:hypothetical protein [Pseudomonadota bacterium]
MQRSDFLSWLEQHPDTIHGDPHSLCDRCEQEVTSHATEDAWLEAKRLIDERRELWEGSWGFHASEAFVARELCHTLARQLRANEPHVEDGDEERLVGAAVVEQLEPEAREQLKCWVHDLAESVEHRAWREIVRFTDRRAKSLEREGRISDDLTWEATHSYAESAAKVADILSHDYEARAHRK